MLLGVKVAHWEESGDAVPYSIIVFSGQVRKPCSCIVVMRRTALETDCSVEVCDRMLDRWAAEKVFCNEPSFSTLAEPSVH